MDKTDTEGLGGAHAGLWWAAKGDWEQAHAVVQVAVGPEADWVHAYLHRVEGDMENARYWYRLAGRPMPTGGHDTEWQQIARALG